MNPSKLPPTSSNRYPSTRTYDVLHIDEDLSPDDIKRSISFKNEGDLRSHPHINPSPALANQHRSPIILPGNHSLPSSRQIKSTRESRVAPRDTHSKLVKRSPKKARPMPQVLTPIEYLEMHSKDTKVTSDAQVVNEALMSPMLTKPSPTSPSANPRNISPSPPTIIPTTTKRPQHERATSVSLPLRSMRSASISKVTPNVAVKSGAPSLPPIAPFASDPEKDAALDPSNHDGPIASTCVLHDTSGTRPEAVAKHRRGISFDLTSLKQPFLSSPNSPSSVHHRIQKRRPLRKAEHMDETNESMERQAEPSNERQRVMNVKRARKMAQLFGSEPPSALYQITNLGDNDIEKDDELISLTDERPTSSLNPSLRSSSVTVRRSASMTSRAEVGLEDNQPGTADPNTWRAPTPPFMPRADSDPLSGSTRAFRLRRRRAAKLTHFFGVGYHDLSTSVPIAVVPPPSPALPPPPRNELSGLQLNRPTTSVEVDVRMSGRNGFWGIVDGRRNVKDPDMNHVISKLREMKAR